MIEDQIPPLPRNTREMGSEKDSDDASCGEIEVVIKT
jgi:hypothetical protein